MRFVSRWAKLIVILTVFFTATLGGVLVMHWLTEEPIANFHGTLLPEPREVQSFSLTGIDNRLFNNASLVGKWTMMFFGFTSCGSICPITMGELAKMYHSLEQNRMQQLPRIVMVSVDPERDTLFKLSRYVKMFHPHFYGAIGDGVAVMAQKFGIMYAKVKNSDTSYDVQHSGVVLLFNPDGKLVAYFTAPLLATQLVKDYMLLVRN
jgi:protein SCO1/2